MFEEENCFISILEKAKKKYGSDKAVAELLGVKSQYIASARAKKGSFSTRHCVALANLLDDIGPYEIIVAAERMRAERKGGNGADSDFWGKEAASLSFRKHQPSSDHDSTFSENNENNNDTTIPFQLGDALGLLESQQLVSAITFKILKKLEEKKSDK
ncbi:hypothetical protein BOW53_15375 [Solemya pervernicosa gill symbiont]|uniref:Uncharacterized protein n=1 Tax=Solemya pervernicosa gill symbiont TaxID=642797 RepID=A0A1T2L0L2_9GAMM|nr:helix-turn-helix domain-containing protein [Solemya pervernicosa gill symbiont]OOZ38496.1 hypothetical protein BOW53_15375 [Solemya pervernicosa gill symbiont]